MERTIRVTGKGTIQVKPDLIQVKIHQSGLHAEYSQAMQLSVEQKTKLTEALEKLGFDKSDLKTVHFNINSEYENFEEQTGRWKRRFVGYRFNHDLKLSFDLDNTMLGRVLYVLTEVEGEPNFSLSYTTKNPEKAKNELLEAAVKDAMAKASVLATAANVRLGDLQTIDYSFGELDIYVNPVNEIYADRAVAMCKAESYDMDIEPEDIQVTDSVTVVWRIV